MTVLTFFVIMLEKVNTNEKLNIVIVEEYQYKSTVKGFHVYKEIWNPVEGEVLDTRMESENPTDNYAACIEKMEMLWNTCLRESRVASAKRFSFF